MAYYETVFMARPDLTETQVKKLTDDFSAIITGQGGKIHKVENWGLRSLAYRINKSRKAHYVLLETEAPSEAITELERQLRLNEDVMRSLTLRQDELSDAPSPIMGRHSSNDDSDDSSDEKSSKDKDKKEAA